MILIKRNTNDFSSSTDETPMHNYESDCDHCVIFYSLDDMTCVLVFIYIYICTWKIIEMLLRKLIRLDNYAIRKLRK